jgi:hypothetical protein
MAVMRSAEAAVLDAGVQCVQRRLPRLAEVAARVRSSSIITLSRASERTRASSDLVDGFVRKSSAPTSRPRTRSAG